MDYFEARFVLGEGQVQLGVDIRVGKIFKLIAGPGYRGAYEKSLRVGMPMRSAIEAFPALQLDGLWNGFVLDAAPGLLVEVDDPDPELSFALDMDVSAISIVVAEFDAPAFHKGEW